MIKVQQEVVKKLREKWLAKDKDHNKIHKGKNVLRNEGAAIATTNTTGTKPNQDSAVGKQAPARFSGYLSEQVGCTGLASALLSSSSIRWTCRVSSYDEFVG